jgi:hypothetical protein
MAIVQISKIIHRTGANIDLPQLDTGEIGFASDTKQVYIGNDPVIHPPGSPSETTQTEILTDASVIGFNQLAGSATTTLNISSNVATGQVLVAKNAEWVNAGGTEGGLITLGNVANVKLTGGVNGYVLQTDGTGNLSWAVNGVMKYEINNVDYLVGDSQGAVKITTKTNHLLPTGATVTIMGVTGSTIQSAINNSGITLSTGGGFVATNRFYIKRLSDTTFSLYTDSNAITDPVIGSGWDDSTPYVTGTGYALGFVSPSGTVTPGGSNTQIQFNDSSSFGGTTNLTFNKTTGVLTVGGNVVASTVTGNIRGNFDGRVGFFTPNTGAFTSITASTTLTATGNVTGGNIKTVGIGNIGTLVVTGTSTLANASIANVKSDHILYANGTPWPIGTGYTSVAGSNTQIQFNNQGQFYGTANLVFDITSNTLTATKIISNGVGLTNLTGANVTGQVGNALVAGTIYTNAQPNITSVGTLTSLAITGNVTSGNANLGNIAIANFFSGNASLLSSITGSNVSGAVTYATTANSVAGANVSGSVAQATYAGTANSVSWSNVASKPSFATVATSGSYTDLSSTPSIPAAQIQSDWNVTDNTLKSYIVNKPSIPAAQIQSDWTQATTGALDYIKNKPTIPDAQIQSDWTQTNNSLKDFIKNKPATGVSPQVLLYNQDNIERTLALTDAGKHIYIKSDSGLYSANIVVPRHFSIAFTIGTKIDVINSPLSATDSNIKLEDDTITSMFLAGYESPSISDNPIVIKPGEIAHLLKVENDVWIVERKR